jgi:nicotinamidase-related amidase
MLELFKNIIPSKDQIPDSKHPGLAGLLIDMNSDMVDEMYDLSNNIINVCEHHKKDLIPHDKDLVLDSQIQMIRYFATTNVPIINISTSGEGSTISLLRNELSKVYNVVKFKKKQYNAFNLGYTRMFSPYKEVYLVEILHDMKINALFLMGMCASVCVYETAIGGIRNRFKVSTADTVIADSVGILSMFSDKRKNDYKRNNVEYFTSHNNFIKSLNNN